MGNYYGEHDSRTPTSANASRQRRSQARGFLSFFSILIIIALLIGGYLIFSNAAPLPQNAAWNLPTLGGPAPTSDVPCEILIQKAIEASGQACNSADSNTACYGNRTITAQLVPGNTGDFSRLGDIVSIDQLLSLAAAPLNLETQEWGVVIMKLLANLPSSLPGETVTMVVFGNTSFTKDAGSLQAFYFASAPGGITCAEAPAEGIVIDVPDGSGITFFINGSELSLSGDASIQAVQGDQMQVSLYNGTGVITANGQSQEFGAGQQVSVQLGGTDGMTSVSAPSTPVPLSAADLALSCTLTGQNCGVSSIPTLSADAIQATLQAAFGTSTPTPKGSGSGSTPVPGSTPPPQDQPPANTKVPPGLEKKTTTPDPKPNAGNSSSSDSQASPTPKK